MYRMRVEFEYPFEDAVTQEQERALADAVSVGNPRGGSSRITRRGPRTYRATYELSLEQPGYTSVILTFWVNGAYSVTAAVIAAAAVTSTMTAHAQLELPQDNISVSVMDKE